MAKYRKKPVIVDVEVYKPGMEDGIDFIEPGEAIHNLKLGLLHESKMYPYIETLEGKHYISEGDYIITGVKGERYPCKPDIFEMTYERVEQ